jgi:peptide/nickel transport system permease protein
LKSNLLRKESVRFRELVLTLRLIKRSKLTVVCIGVIALLYLTAILAPYLAPYSPYELDLKNKLIPPNSEHLLGTDQLGRDILSRLMYGARTSLMVGVLVVSIIIIIGLPLGLVAGYFGGKVDELIMRITDMFMSFPGITLAMLLAYILGRGTISALIALSLVQWTSIARLVRSVVLSEREKEYAIAAKALGKNTFRILFEEILPNALHPVIVISTLQIGSTIIWASALSFVGVGVQPPEPDWGVMISEGYKFIMDQPWAAITPGILIIVTVLSFNLIGDTLRDILDPQIRRRLSIATS